MHSCGFYRSYKHRTKLPRAVVWAGFLEDLVLVFPAVTVCGGLTLPDPGRREHHGAWDIQVPDVLHSSVYPTEGGELFELGEDDFLQDKQVCMGRKCSC